MRSLREQKQLEFLIIDAINQQPVRLDMAFPEVAKFASQRVVMAFRVKGFLIREFIDDIAIWGYCGLTMRNMYLR